MCVCVCVCVCVYYYPFVIISFYSLGTRLCTTTCSNSNIGGKVWYVCYIGCKEPCLFSSRWLNNCQYCKRHSHSDPKTWYTKCKTQGLADGSDTKFCSTCNLLCCTNGCKKKLANSGIKFCSTCNLLCHKIGCKKASVHGDTKLCSMCVSLCHVYTCMKKMADGDATLYSNCCLNHEAKLKKNNSNRM